MKIVDTLLTTLLVMIFLATLLIVVVWLVRLIAAHASLVVGCVVVLALLAVISHLGKHR